MGGTGKGEILLALPPRVYHYVIVSTLKYFITSNCYVPIYTFLDKIINGSPMI